MTKSMSYCSLEEAWGDNYTQTKSNTDISYSGGTQQSDELIPQYMKNENTISQNIENTQQLMPIHNTDRESIHKNLNVTGNPSNSMVALNDINKEQLWEEFIKFIQTKNIQQMDTSHPNIKESFTNIENFDIKSIKNDNSYVDLMILILFGIIMIFIMDSFVRLGKNMKD
jgi:hypothetical protein